MRPLAQSPEVWCARLVSAVQWRTSPRRNWPVMVGSIPGVPATSASVRATFLDPPWDAAPDVDHLSVGREGFNRCQDGVHHVVDRDEVAGLAPILVNNRRFARQESAQENGEDARVRVAEGLPRPVDIKHPETDHREVVDRSEAQGQLLLIPLRQCIDVSCEKGSPFGSGDGLQQFRRLGTDGLPSRPSDLGLGPDANTEEPAV